MEVSAKQEGAKRFDDPGIAAALAGDTDADGLARGLLSGGVNCGKMEPKVSWLIPYPFLHTIGPRTP